MEKKTIKQSSYKIYSIENYKYIRRDYAHYFQNPKYPEIQFSALYILLNDDKKQHYIGFSSNPTERLCTHKSKPKFKWSKALVFEIDGDKYDEHLDATDAQYLEYLSLKCVMSEGSWNGKGSDKVYIKSKQKENMKKYFREFVYPQTKEYAPYVFKNEVEVNRIIEDPTL